MDKSLLNLFAIQTDFAQGGLLRFLVTLLVSFAFSLAMSAVYKIYYRENEPVDASISRSFPLMGPAVTTIFWMIQFSLPLSLGLLGALSFVRFRTPIKRAEDIAFILILIAGSLACAIGQFVSILILLSLIFIYGSLRDYIPGANNSNKKFAILTIHSSLDLSLESIIEILTREVATSVSPVSILKQDSISTYVLNLNRFDKTNTQKIIREIYLVDKKAKVNIFFPENQYGVN